MWNSVTAPIVVFRPSCCSWNAVDKRLQWGPVPIAVGQELAGAGNSVIAPETSRRAILSTEVSVNQRFPSGPSVMREAVLEPLGSENSTALAPVVIRPILLASS